jgi:hypothetical protein
MNEGAIPWCTWYGIRAVALHKKRTHHGQPRSITVCCGQSKMPTMQRQFAKALVGKSGLVIARLFFAKVRVAGSNLVVRSKRTPWSEGVYARALRMSRLAAVRRRYTKRQFLVALGLLEAATPQLDVPSATSSEIGWLTRPSRWPGAQGGPERRVRCRLRRGRYPWTAQPPSTADAGRPSPRTRA